jgi:Probable zinc-ribbon domain
MAGAQARRQSSMPYTDTLLTCSDCGTAFVFRARDQETYVANGFTTPPNRCPSCRRLTRA